MQADNGGSMQRQCANGDGAVQEGDILLFGGRFIRKEAVAVIQIKDAKLPGNRAL
ncbi:hypothetical protein A0J51_02053 [Gluconobacter japonicus]|nr:hypothetical protein A0J51_02053 [Gluconobacter japonicus]